MTAEHPHQSRLDLQQKSNAASRLKKSEARLCAIREGAPLILAAPIEKGALPAPLLYQPVGTVNWKVRAAVAE